MAVVRRLIHAASNGDRWFLCRGGGPADTFVFHEPNRPSGGLHSRIEFSTFLASGQGCPERLALLRIIGSLVEVGGEAPSTPPSGPEPGAAGAEPSPGEEASTP